MKNPWKFESNEKLSSKISNGPTSPIGITKIDSFPPPSKFDLEPSSNLTDDKNSQKGRRNKGLAVKMKAKIQEQLRNVYKQLEERENELGSLHSELQKAGQAIKERRRIGQDLVNNEQMLQFKEKQLNNLMTIHAQLLEGAKKDILNEKSIKFSHDEKVVTLKKRITDYNSRTIERRHLQSTVETLTLEKARLEEQLKIKRETQAKKNQIRSQAIRELLQELVRRNKREIEEICEKKVRTIREASTHLKDHKQLRKLLQERNGVRPSEYYTFGQLKYVQQLNFRTHPECEKVMRIFYREVNPKIPEIIEHFQQPEEFIKLKEELISLEKSKTQKEAQIKKKQSELQRLQDEKSKLKKAIAELKAKTQIKK